MTGTGSQELELVARSWHADLCLVDRLIQQVSPPSPRLKQAKRAAAALPALKATQGPHLVHQNPTKDYLDHDMAQAV